MQYAEALKRWWNAASPLARALLVSGLMAAVFAVGYLNYGKKAHDFVPLYTRLNPSDGAAILENLRQKKIEYQLQDSGETILVPRDQVHELRLDLASSGLPKGGGVGFEIFDQNAMMMTDFTQRVNYGRALQGELSRTISQLPQVESARVHLSLPDRSIFSRGKTEPAASVYVKLYQGRTLSDRQVAGIKHLVATGIENLAIDRVAVIDGDGRILGSAPGMGQDASAKSLTVTHEHEERLEKRVIELLEPIVGPGRVVARVNAELDLSRTEETKEEYDPESATIRSEKKLNENQASQSQSPAGVAGTPGNIPQNAAATALVQNGSQSNSGRNSTQVDYAISRVVRHTKRPSGNTSRLTVAVLIDSTEFMISPSTDGATEKSGVAVPDPETGKVVNKPQPDLDALTSLVKKAVGFDLKRGDEVQLSFMPFAHPELADAVPEPKLASIPAWLIASVFGLFAIVMIGAGTFMVQRKRKQLEALRAERLVQEAEQAKKQREAAPVEAELKGNHLREEVQRLAAQNLEGVKIVMKTWLAENAAPPG